MHLSYSDIVQNALKKWLGEININLLSLKPLFFKTLWLFTIISWWTCFRRIYLVYLNLKKRFFKLRITFREYFAPPQEKIYKEFVFWEIHKVVRYTWDNIPAFLKCRWLKSFTFSTNDLPPLVRGSLIDFSDITNHTTHNMSNSSKKPFKVCLYLAV